MKITKMHEEFDECDVRNKLIVSPNEALRNELVPEYVKTLIQNALNEDILSTEAENDS